MSTPRQFRSRARIQLAEAVLRAEKVPVGSAAEAAILFSLLAETPQASRRRESFRWLDAKVWKHCSGRTISGDVCTRLRRGRRKRTFENAVETLSEQRAIGICGLEERGGYQLRQKGSFGVSLRRRERFAEFAQHAKFALRPVCLPRSDMSEIFLRRRDCNAPLFGQQLEGSDEAVHARCTLALTCRSKYGTKTYPYAPSALVPGQEAALKKAAEIVYSASCSQTRLTAERTYCDLVNVTATSDDKLEQAATERAISRRKLLFVKTLAPAHTAT